MNRLLKSLLGLLFPGVEGENDDVDPPGDDPALDPVDDDDDLDLPDVDLPDDPPAHASSRRSATDDRLAKLEAEVERRARIADEARARQPVAPDETFQREEERLRANDITDLERWQIQSNRTLRASEARATQALMQAQELSDRTRFEAKMKDDPRRAKYADRVEAEITKDRSRGGGASREDVYYWMLGKDIADGKLKAKSKPAPAASNVARGRSPAVRSDVQARGARTERDKRIARLQDQNI